MADGDSKVDTSQPEQLGMPVGLHPNEAMSSPLFQQTMKTLFGDKSPQQVLQEYGVMSPATVGTAPPQLVQPHLPPGVNLPGMNPSAPAMQVGGPVARTAPYPNAGAMEYRSRAGRDAAIIGNAIQSLNQFAVQQKQKSFEKEAATMEQLTSQVINGALLKDKVSSGGQITATDLETAALGEQFKDPKQQKMLLKLIDKAQKDPMSGAYVGMQRAYSNLMQRNQAALAEEKAKSEIYQNYAQGFGQAATGYGRMTYDVGATQMGKVATAVSALEKAETGRKEEERRVAKDWTDRQDKARKEGMLLTKDAQGREIQRPMKWEEMGTAERAKIESKVRTDAAKRAQMWQTHDLQTKRLAFAQKKEQFDEWLKKEQLKVSQDRIKGKALGDPKIIAQIQDRMSRGSLTADYAQQLIDLVSRRPDMFGMMGAGKNMIKKMFAEQDPDAALFEDIANRLGITVVGMHTRSAVLARDNMNSLHGFWKSPEALITRLQAIKQAGDDIASGKDWPAAIPRPSTISPEGIRPSTVAPGGGTSTKPTTPTGGGIDDEIKSLGGVRH